MSKLPLYLGLFVFVVAVLFSAIKVGEKSSLTYQRTRAGANTAQLELKFTSPDLVTLVLNSEKEVAGIDAVIKFDKSKIAILPSTLGGSPSFIATGGVVDEEKSTFSFSALAKEVVSSGMVANFNIIPAQNLKTADSELQLVRGEKEGSAVLEKATSQNILNTTVNARVNVSSK